MKRKIILGVAFALLLSALLLLLRRGDTKGAGDGCSSTLSRPRLGDCRLSAPWEGDRLDRATFSARTEVINEGKAVDEVVIEIALLDHDGRQAAFISDVVEEIREGEVVTDTASVDIKGPHLWSYEAPYLYTVIVELKDKRGKTLETKSTSFAFRKEDESGPDPLP